jgi:hypothetical protein
VQDIRLVFIAEKRSFIRCLHRHAQQYRMAGWPLVAGCSKQFPHEKSNDVVLSSLVANNELGRRTMVSNQMGSTACIMSYISSLSRNCSRVQDVWTPASAPHNAVGVGWLCAQCHDRQPGGQHPRQFTVLFEAIVSDPCLQFAVKGYSADQRIHASAALGCDMTWTR